MLLKGGRGSTCPTILGFVRHMYIDWLNWHIDWYSNEVVAHLQSFASFSF
jgi:hypothetical protein